jgi:hypothetical protein
VVVEALPRLAGNIGSVSIRLRTEQYVLKNPDLNIATTRTTVNTGALAFVVYLVQRFTDVEVDVTDPVVLAVAPFAVGLFYRVSRFLAAKYPSLVRVLFGYGETPIY